MSRIDEIDQRTILEINDVKDFGAVGDYSPSARTGTDDSAAFTAVWADMIFKAASSVTEPGHTPSHTAKNIVIPPGFYRIDNSINWTDTKIQNVHVWAYGAVLYGRCAGKAVVDLLGSRYVTIHGLTVYGDPTDTPRAGLQYGRFDSVSIGNNHFIDITTEGEFTLAGSYNVACETTRHDRCRYQNSKETDDTFAYLGDGRNHWAVASGYVTVSITQPQEMSFTNNIFSSCEFRHWGGYDPVWLSSTVNHEFDKGCYFLAFDQSNVRLWSTSVSRQSNLTLEGLFESNQDNIPSGSGNTGVQTVIEIEGDATATTLLGLTFKTSSITAASEVLKFTNTGVVKIQDADIRMGAFTEAGVTFVPAGTSLSLSGRVVCGDVTKLNLDQITSFVGDVLVNVVGSLSYPPDGAYRAMGFEDAFQIIDNVRNVSFDGWATATFSGGVLTISRVLSAYGTVNTITDIDWITNIKTDGFPLIVIRNSSASDTLTFTFNASKIRTLSGADVTVAPYESITFVPVSATIVQQIAGSL